MHEETKPRRVPAAQRARWFSAAALLVAALSWSVPLLPELPDSSVDASWSQATLEASARGAVFGRDVVFTYGPWAWLQADAYHPHTYVRGLLWGTVLGLWLWWSLLRLRSVLDAGPVAALGWVVLVVLSRSVHALALCAPLLVVVSSSKEGRRALYLAASGVALAMGILAKASNAPAVALVAVALFVRDRRSGAVFALAVAAGLVALWLGAGQPLSALAGYARGAWELTAGYAEAMGRAGHAGAVVAFLVASLCIGAWSLVSVPGPIRGSVVVVVVGTLFLAFKSAFVRHDVHALIGAAALVDMVLFCGMMSSWSSGAARRAVVMAVLGCAAFIALSVGPAALKPGERFSSSRSQASALLGGGKAALDARYAARLIELRRFHPLPSSALAALTDAAPAVDVMPHGLNAALSRGWRVVPRPTLQSYAAYTSWLVAQNEAHLRSPAGAPTLLLTGRAIDGHPLLMEDGSSWRAVLEHYAPDDDDAAGVVWRRRPAARPLVAEPPRAHTVARGAPFSVETGCTSSCGVTWLQAEVRLSLWGKLCALVLRPPSLHIELTLADGTQEQRRLIPALARSGFVVSPLLDRAEQVATLVRGEPTARVVSARIVSDAPWAYEDTDAVTLTRLTLPD